MITILGPTACGKTQLAVALACRLGGEILSADSRQVYRRMDIGTGKDLADYEVDGPDGQRRTIAHHLIDICEPGTKYNLYQYLADFRRAYQEVVQRGAVPILCGGTGLYLEAVLRDYQLPTVPQNPELRARLEGKSLAELTAMLADLKRLRGTHMHNTTDVDTAQRAIRAIEIELGSQENNPSPSSLHQSPVTSHPSPVFGLSIPRELRRERITSRLKARLQAGMADEVRRLLAEGIAPDDLIYYGLEYKYVTEYVVGRLSREEMFRLLEIAIHQFAKRQMTWFRGMERRGTPIHWIDATQPIDQQAAAVVSQLTTSMQ